METGGGVFVVRRGNEHSTAALKKGGKTEVPREKYARPRTDKPIRATRPAGTIEPARPYKMFLSFGTNDFDSISLFVYFGRDRTTAAYTRTRNALASCRQARVAKLLGDPCTLHGISFRIFSKKRQIGVDGTRVSIVYAMLMCII